MAPVESELVRIGRVWVLLKANPVPVVVLEFAVVVLKLVLVRPELEASKQRFAERILDPLRVADLTTDWILWVPVESELVAAVGLRMEESMQKLDRVQYSPKQAAQKQV